MWRHVGKLSLMASLASCGSGCSLVQPAESNVQTEPGRQRVFGCRELGHLTVESNVQTEPGRQQTLEALKEMEVFLQGSVPKLDPQQLKAGQHIQILTGGVPHTRIPEIMIHSTMIAGTVKVMDGDRLVLQDDVMIKEGRSKRNKSFTSRIPYVSRWGKSTGIGRESTAVPGEVAIKLSEILNASELTDVEFEAVRKNGGGYERIGVDFDFNVADGLEATPHQ